MKKSLLLGLILMGVAFGSVEAAKISYEELELEDNIYVIVPKVEGLKDLKAQERLNAEFRSHLGAVKEFQEDLDPEQAFEYSFGYETPYNELGLISVVQWSYIYSGGAHGNTYYKTMTYYEEKDLFLKLPDIFDPGTSYAEFLNPLVNQELVEREGKDHGFYFKSVDENTKFYLTPSGLVLLFAPYDIAPYVMGTTRIHIPWWKLEGKLNQAYYLY